MTSTDQIERRRRFTHRALPLGVIALAALMAGLVVGLSADRDGRQTVERFAQAWTSQDFEAMHAELTDAARESHPLERFRAAYLESYQVATTISIRAGRPRETDGGRVFELPVRTRTHAFGEVEDILRVALENERIAWEPHLVFPALQPGEQLSRRTRAPRRASILARDRTPLAAGDERTSPLGEAARHVTGRLGDLEDKRAAARQRAGFSEDEPGGVSGLEKAFDERLRGTPGGELLAGPPEGDSRVVARGEPKPAKPLRTTIDPELQQAAVAALGERLGGVVALDARDGSIRALAGIGYSTSQPPGSTFKIVTAAAALESGKARLETRFPVEETTTVGGREIRNAHEEACGGKLVESFAKSCNTVFAPLGVQVGSARLVEMAEKFGFNAPPQIFSEKITEIVEPAPGAIPRKIGSRLDLAVSAIGQGRLLATPLLMASVAQTVATGGMRHPTPIATESELTPDAQPVRAISAKTARALRRMMIAVVVNGTGSQAAIAGAQVAGKTGTAELGPKPREGEVGDIAEAAEEQEVDAWFTGFAPARRPRVVVAVMIVKADGEGGDIAAPAARQVMAAAIQD